MVDLMVEVPLINDHNDFLNKWCDPAVELGVVKTSLIVCPASSR